MSNNVTLYNSKNIDKLVWTSDDIKLKDYFINVVKHPLNHYIQNATAEFQLLKIDSVILPITICDFIPNNTYLVSVFTQYINYTIEELKVIKNLFFRKTAHFILKILGAILKLSKVDKCIHVNNWLFPTNIYPSISAEQIQNITSYLTNKFPNHAILFRTLNFITDSFTLKNLQKNQYLLIGSRQVHILTKAKLNSLPFKKSNDLKRDKKILNNSEYNIENEKFDQEDINRMKKLYDYLYLDKHSYFNPQFTQAFFNTVTNNPLFETKVLRINNQVDAFIGCFIYQGIAYAPLFGYDTQQHKKNGLYRMLSTIKISFAVDHDTTLHSSAGAGGFKRRRGHESTPEYHAVFTKHLSMGRRITWLLLKWIVNKIGIPLIQRYDN